MNNRIPPQAIDMERAVLGALLLETEIRHEVEPLLTADSFYVPAHQLIWQAITHLAQAYHPVDMLTVTEELSRMKKLDAVGGAYYISELASVVAGTSHTHYHAQIVAQKAHSRRLMHLAGQLVEQCYDESRDIYDVQEHFEKQFTQLVAGTTECSAWDMPRILKETIDRAVRMQEKREKGETTAIPTGLPELDKALLGGWQKQDLVIVGARPSMGKTQFALFFARNAAMHGSKVLIASTESDEVPLITRYLLEDERINPHHLRTGQMTRAEWDAMDETIGKLWNLPIHIAGHYQIRKLATIKSEARSLKRKQGLDMLIVDYIGLVKPEASFDRRYEELGYITAELKNLAKELDIVVIALSQLTRPPKGILVKMPVLEDLRESGNIEQDADIVLTLHKPAYYNPTSTDKKGRSWQNRGQLHIAKQREGPRELTLEFEHDQRYKKIW